MSLPAHARTACLCALGCWNLIALRATAADLLPGLQLGSPSVESSVKELHLRKFARNVLGLGAGAADEDSIWLGPVRAQLLWKRKWTWPEARRQQSIAAGLLGGPMLSIDIPLGPFAEFMSLETRFCSLRYAYSDLRTSRSLLDELADPQDQRQSLEGGLYINIALGTLF
jgi:hypothetical protein